MMYILLSLALSLVHAQEAAPSCHAGGDKQVHGASTQIHEHDGTTVEDETVDGERIKTVTFKDLKLRGLYPSMTGPWKRTYLYLLRPEESAHLWITGYRAEVLDANGEASQEFMCHTNLDLAEMKENGDVEQTHSQLSISQGQKEIRFPAGFALRLDNTGRKSLDLNAMVLNNNYPKLKKNLSFRSRVSYLSDKEAEERKLKPLGQTSAYIACELKTCRSATKEEIETDPEGVRRTGHWLVKPGHEEITTDVTHQLALKSDTRLHYIWMHVHPYATSLELKDATSGQTVWKGKVDVEKKIAAVKATEMYSSAEGLPVFKDHKYTLTSVYDNPTKKPVDAMAALWMYHAL